MLRGEKKRNSPVSEMLGATDMCSFCRCTHAIVVRERHCCRARGWEQGRLKQRDSCCGLSNLPNLVNHDPQPLQTMCLQDNGQSYNTLYKSAMEQMKIAAAVNGAPSAVLILSVSAMCHQTSSFTSRTGWADSF